MDYATCATRLLLRLSPIHWRLYTSVWRLLKQSRRPVKVDEQLANGDLAIVPRQDARVDRQQH
jgi:hypothetical protein